MYNRLHTGRMMVSVALQFLLLILLCCGPVPVYKPFPFFLPVIQKFIRTKTLRPTYKQLTKLLSLGKLYWEKLKENTTAQNL